MKRKGPMESVTMETGVYDTGVRGEAIRRFGALKTEAPTLEGVPTGIPGLDELFFTTRMTGDGRIEQHPLGGIPQSTLVNKASYSTQNR